MDEIKNNYDDVFLRKTKDDFEYTQRSALNFLEMLYGQKFERPTKCFVEGCEETEIYNSGACKKHAF